MGVATFPQQVVLAFPPGELVDSMVQLTSWCAEDLRSHTSAINLQRDSQQLQWVEPLLCHTHLYFVCIM